MFEIIAISLLSLLTVVCIYDTYKSNEILKDCKKKTKLLEDEYNSLKLENRNYYEIIKN